MLNKSVGPLQMNQTNDLLSITECLLILLMKVTVKCHPDIQHLKEANRITISENL